MSEIYVGLFRGINVGGKNQIQMRELTAMFLSHGCDDVRTYIQSGNVLFRSSAALAERIPDLIRDEIGSALGFAPPILLRSAKEIAEVIRHNPFLTCGAPEETLHVMFLANPPSEQQLGELDPLRSPTDTFVARGKEVYLHLPSGVARTKLTNIYFDSKLATTSTSRNWRTVTKLHELMTA